MRCETKFCAPIGPWPRAARPLRPEVVSFVHPSRYGQAVELSCTEHRDMNRLHRSPGPRSDNRPRVASVLHFCSGTSSALRLVLVNELVPSTCHVTRVIWAMHLHLCMVVTASRQRCEEVRDDLSRLWEILVAEVASEGRR